jgi:hypothetical protein
MPRLRLTALFQLCVTTVTTASLCSCGGGGGDAGPTTSDTAPAPATGVAPVAEAAAITTAEDQRFQGALHASDADGDPLTYSLMGSPTHLSVVVDPATGAYELRPFPNYFGVDGFDFKVTDGHGNIAHAHVDVTISAVPDPPSIDTSSTTSVVAAGRDVELHFAISDPDGDAVTLSVTQGPGTAPLPNLRVNDQEVSFHAPEVTHATAVELFVLATDSTGLVRLARHVITLSPVSSSGKLFTVMGSPQAEGLHWIITGDGFSADQQQDLLRASLVMAGGITGAPELARHAGILNVHVLTAVSRDSGVAIQGATRQPHTAYDATLGCTDVARVACVDWDKVNAALLAEGAPFDEVAVVLNTTTYVGNTSGSGLIVSRNPYAATITLHEMGHVVAGLADEYVDKNVADAFSPRYREGQFANVTTVTDPARIPWRHWFADPAHIPVTSGEAGVGRFEGAFYAANGYFRPKQDSIMRTLAAPVGEVNGEAWIRALYRAVPPISAANPEQRVVAGLPGTPLTFEIVSPWSVDLLQVRWFVDGVEDVQYRGMFSYALQADGARHEVRVSVEDCTGRIRSPDAGEQLGSVVWTVSDEPLDATAKAQLRATRIAGWIRMRVDSSGHRLLGSSPIEPRRVKSMRVGDESDFEYALYDGMGALLSEGRIADPRVVRGPLGPPGEPDSGHEQRMLPNGYYLIGIPEGAAARKLRIRSPGGSLEKAGQDEQWLDL